MHFRNGVEGSVENPKKRWAEETKTAIEFEEDPHRAALSDNPDLVYVGPRTWGAVFALSLSLGAPIGLTLLSLASVADEVTRELGAQELRTWVVGSWSIANGCSAAVAGYFSDTFGRRNVIIAGDLIVLLGCILGGTARSIEVLVTAQTVIGFGAGFVFDVFAAVPEMLPNKWRALGAGLVEGGINVPWATISVILANAVTRYASWRWIYYISILLSFIALKATALLYWPVSRPKGDFHRTRWEQVKELDYVGIASITGGIALFTCGLTWGGRVFHWNHPGSILPTSTGLLTILGGFAYDFTMAKNPMVPVGLFRPPMFRRYLAILIVLFVSGMNFYAMTSLLPLGSSLMFTVDGLEAGVMSLPNTVMQLVAGFIFPLVAHRIPRYVPRLTIKWQLVVGMAMQATFLALSALSVAPNNMYAYIFVPAFGTPMFTWVTILSYATASLHVPHSQLGTALGFLGTFRSTGGAVGNAIFGTLFSMLSARRTSERVREACRGLGRLGLCPNATALESLLAETTAYNGGMPGTLADLAPDARDSLREALRFGYGQSFRIVFCATIPLSVIALICSLYVEDPWPYMNNHVQFRMYEQGIFKLGDPDDPALTGATGLWAGNKRILDGGDGDHGMELARVGSQSSRAPLNARPLWYPYHFLTTQFRPLPYPNTNYQGKTVLVTGANVGLGKEAARHFCRLGAARVILACRDLEKGRVARADIEASTSKKGVVDVWQVDLTSFQSVKDFCRRADAELDRLDVVVENAGVAIGTFIEADGGFESTIAINVVSTFLMALMLLPAMRRTAARFNVEPRLVIVSSDAHMFAKFCERNEPKIFDAFKVKAKMNEDRYNTSKLLPIWIARELAARMPTNEPVIVNALNPGFCRTDLFRHAPLLLSFILKFGVRIIGRTTEMGSRTLVAAAAAGRESHGGYLDSCVLREPSTLVVSEEGGVLQKRVYDELMEILEDIQPGITDNVA